MRCIDLCSNWEINILWNALCTCIHMHTDTHTNTYAHAYIHLHMRIHACPTLLSWQLGSLPKQSEITHGWIWKKRWLVTRSFKSRSCLGTSEEALFDQTPCVLNCILFYSFPKSCPKCSSHPFHSGTPAISVCVSLTQLAWLEGVC